MKPCFWRIAALSRYRLTASRFDGFSACSGAPSHCLPQVQDKASLRVRLAHSKWPSVSSTRPARTSTIACPPFKQGIQGPEMIEGKKAGPFQWIAFTYQFNMTGQPAVTVPAGFTKDGLPIGLQIVGGHLDDATVLRAAAAYEAAAPWKDKWPPMLAQMGL